MEEAGVMLEGRVMEEAGDGGGRVMEEAGDGGGKSDGGGR